MRNSVRQSGFTHPEKEKHISKGYLRGGVDGNDPSNTDIPDCREAFRHESLLEEYYWVYKKNKLHDDHGIGKKPQDRHETHHTILVPKDTRWKWKPKALTKQAWPTDWL